jgi:hypothetical protein
MQVIIEQVEGEFMAHDFAMSLSKSTINKYVARDKVGEFPVSCGMERWMPRKCFEMLVLTATSYFQINQVNECCNGK